MTNKPTSPCNKPGQWDRKDPERAEGQSIHHAIEELRSAWNWASARASTAVLDGFAGSDHTSPFHHLQPVDDMP